MCHVGWIRVEMTTRVDFVHIIYLWALLQHVGIVRLNGESEEFKGMWIPKALSAIQNCQHHHTYGIEFQTNKLHIHTMIYYYRITYNLVYWPVRACNRDVTGLEDWGGTNQSIYCSLIIYLHTSILHSYFHILLKGDDTRGTFTSILTASYAHSRLDIKSQLLGSYCIYVYILMYGIACSHTKVYIIAKQKPRQIIVLPNHHVCIYSIYNIHIHIVLCMWHVNNDWLSDWLHISNYQSIYLSDIYVYYTYEYRL